MNGRTAPKASNGHEYILVAIDYFTKWVESASYSILKAKHVTQFIENNIICRFGVPQEIISDNGSHKEKSRRSSNCIRLRFISLYRIDCRLIGP